MNGSSLTAQLFGHFATRIITCVVAMIAVLALFPVQGRSVHGECASPDNSATLQGSVRDSRGRAVAAAIVYLRAKGGSQLLTAHTDSAGTYRFSALRHGEYVVRAELAGYGEAISGSFVLGESEIKSV